MLLLIGCWLLLVMVPIMIPADSARAVTRATLVRVATPAPAARRIARAVQAVPAPVEGERAPGSRRAPIPVDVETGRWMFDMPSAQQFEFRAAIANAPALVRRAAKDFDARTQVRVLERTQCGELYSCSIGIVTERAGVRTSSYSLEFLARSLDGSEAARFLILHEVGHLVDYEGLTGADAARFASAFRASPSWKDCFPNDGSCLAMDELFADQFAIYATGAATSLTTYATPRLLSDAAFEALLRATYLT